MGGFANTIMSMLLGWMRALVDAVWKLIESPGASGILAWFGKSWWLFALLLIAAGLVIDWFVWLIRWQPYHIWATRLRHARRFFARMFGRTVEVVEPVGYDAGRHMPARPTYVERRKELSADAGYSPAYEQDYVDFLDEEAQPEALEEKPEAYDSVDYWDEDIPEAATAAAYDGSFYEQQSSGYSDEAYDEDGQSYADPLDDPQFDPHAAYRRPMPEQISPFSIPDKQLRNYPGKRYDPNKPPLLVPLADARDPLAPYDAYPEAASMPLPPERPAAFEAEEPFAPPDRHASEPSVSGRRLRRREGQGKAAQEAAQAPVQEPEQMTGESNSPVGYRRRKARQAPEPDYVEADTDASFATQPDAPAEEAVGTRRRASRQAYSQSQEAAYSAPLYQEPAYGEPVYHEPEPEPRDAQAEAWREDVFEADDLPDPPKWPEWNARKHSAGGGKPLRILPLNRERKPGENKGAAPTTPKRGMLAQMLDPPVDSIKGLPPRVEVRRAFHKPTYPQQYDPRQGDSGPWDDDT